MILAGIDIGTNSLRLLVAEVGPDSFQEIVADRRTTRLGRGLDSTGMISPESAERSWNALVDFAEAIRRHNAHAFAAIGTSALRNASNSREFIRIAKIKTNIDIQVISGVDEARLALLGVSLELTRSGSLTNEALKRAVVLDIGGGSTEVIKTSPGEDPVITSLPLGAVYLADRFIKHDPPTTAEIVQLRKTVSDTLDAHARTIRPYPGSIVVGTAGTINTLASIDRGLLPGDLGRQPRALLTRESIDNIVERLGSLTLEARRGIRGLEHGREDIILPGAIVIQELLQRLESPSMLVSHGGIKEGILLDLYDKTAKHEALLKARS